MIPKACVNCWLNEIKRTASKKDFAGQDVCADCFKDSERRLHEAVIERGRLSTQFLTLGD